MPFRRLNNPGASAQHPSYGFNSPPVGAFEGNMKTRSLGWIRNGSAICLFAVCVTAAVAQTSAQPQSLPDSPGAVIGQNVIEERGFQQQTPSAISPSQQSQPQSQSQSSPQSSSTGSQASPTQKPVGTAAAEAPATTGVAASNPAGAAIAPAKQKRARQLLIRVGAILGAGVAVGTVAALASASPSKPAGAAEAFRRDSSH